MTSVFKKQVHKDIIDGFSMRLAPAHDCHALKHNMPNVGKYANAMTSPWADL